MNSNYLSHRKQKIMERICKLQQQAALLPEGTFICIHNGKHTKWYHKHKGIYSCIPKKNKAFAEQLALKTYLVSYIQDLKDELCAIDAYTKHFNPEQQKARKLLSDQTFQELLSNYFRPISKELHEWSQAPYEHNSVSIRMCTKSGRHCILPRFYYPES